VAVEGPNQEAACLSTPPTQAGQALLCLASCTPRAQRGVAPLVALVKQEYLARRPRATPSQALLHHPVGVRQGVGEVAVAVGIREAVVAGIRAAVATVAGIRAPRLKRPLKTPGEADGGQVLNGTRPRKMLLLAPRIAVKNLVGPPGEMLWDGAQLRAASLSLALGGGSPRLVRSSPRLGGGSPNLGGGSPHLVGSSPRPVGGKPPPVGSSLRLVGMSVAPRNRNLRDLHPVHPQSHTALPGDLRRQKVISVGHQRSTPLTKRRGEQTFPPRPVLTNALLER